MGTKIRKNNNSDLLNTNESDHMWLVLLFMLKMWLRFY